MSSAEPGAELRDLMVEDHIRARGVLEPRVIAAMRKVPRHAFVPDELAAYAYTDQPLPIGEGQTISQPFVVAFMTEVARPEPTDRALDIGTGTGYQAAVLGELVARVVSVEIRPALAEAATARLARLGYANVEVRCGDGSLGAPDAAPFDVILVAAAPEQVPRALVEQLAPGGRLVIPVGPQGPGGQDLMLIEKRLDGSTLRRVVLAVRFVPMIGAAGA